MSRVDRTLLFGEISEMLRPYQIAVANCIERQLFHKFHIARTNGHTLITFCRSQSHALGANRDLDHRTMWGLLSEKEFSRDGLP